MMERVLGKGDEFLKSTSRHLSSSVVAVAIKGNKKSKHVVQWALDKFVPEGRIIFKLIHVHAVGNVIPISQAHNDVAAAFKEVEWQTCQMLLPFKKMCDQRKVHADVVGIESEDVGTAIVEEVAKGAISKLVIGASSHALFTRKLKGLSAKILTCTPRFCTVYAVSKGRLSSLRPSDIETDGSLIDDSSETSCSTDSSSNYTSTSQTDSGSVASFAPRHSSSLAAQRYQALSTINQTLLNTKSGLIETSHSRCQSLDLGIDHTATSSPAITSDIDYALNQASSCKSNLSDIESCSCYQSPTMDVLLATDSPDRQANFNLELEKLRIELRHARGMHTMAQSQTINASQIVLSIFSCLCLYQFS